MPASSPEVVWEPHEGPQTAFLQAGEFEVLYGGAAGGGKSDALLFGGLRHIDKPTYKGVFIRRTYPELTEMIDRSFVFKRLGGEWNATDKRWVFPSGAIYEFKYFERWEHHTNFQGHQYQYVAWDELGTCPEERYWVYLRSRCRSPADPRITPQMVASANPGGAGHAWLKKRWVDRCGLDGATVYVDPETGLTRRFIPARLKDNPTLLKNDPQYVRLLESLPDVMRKQLLEGDWGAAAGLALGELDHRTHLIKPGHELYQLQPWATYFGAFDWGFMHPASFGVFEVLPGKVILLADSVQLWRKSPLEIAERVDQKLDQLGSELSLDGPLRLEAVHASRDCFDIRKARGENTPTIADHFRQYGLHLLPANQDRVFGLNNMRSYITTIGKDAKRVDPKFFVRSTPSNLQVFDCLEGIVVDPKDPEDSLKVDADEYGLGGDDDYDMVRYGLSSRPLEVRAPRPKVQRDPNYDYRGDMVIKKHPLQRRLRRR